jgi:hypothetical protein
MNRVHFPILIVFGQWRACCRDHTLYLCDKSIVNPGWVIAALSWSSQHRSQVTCPTRFNSDSPSIAIPLSFLNYIIKSRSREPPFSEGLILIHPTRMKHSLRGCREDGEMYPSRGRLSSRKTFTIPASYSSYHGSVSTLLLHPR